MEREIITSTLPSSASARGVSSVPPPTLVLLPTAIISTGSSTSTTTSPSTTMRSRSCGGLKAASIAPIG